MPKTLTKKLTKVRVTKDGDTVYIDNAEGTLHYADSNSDVYVYVKGGNRPRALVINDKYQIECAQKEFGIFYGFLVFRCISTGDPAGFKMDLLA